jgi:Zn finger protein HypA/HybF involved in hydrogenase expression
MFFCPGTIAEDAKLVSSDVPARFWCPHCSTEFVRDFSPIAQFADQGTAGREMLLTWMD